jgi:DNA polymerase elongation subunit (family B)
MTDRSLDEVLFGADPAQRVVAVETSDQEVTLFVRGDDDVVRREKRPFTPWLLVDRERHFAGAETTRLEGSGYHFLIRFPEGWKAFLDARRALRDEHAGVLQYGSAAKQFLIASGITLFKGMTYDDLVRMQIDIETTSLSPRVPDAAVFMVAIADNRGFQTVLTGDERDILEQTRAIVQERDPDVIEGHNIYGFDLPYLAERCQAHGMPLDFGRDRAKAATGSERNCAIGPNSRPFTPYYIWGRHVIDTLFQVQRFDIAKGALSSYGLKECAQVYGIAPEGRVYLDRREITTLFAEDPARVTVYAAQDVQETAALAALVTPTEFYQTQMVPDVFGAIAVTGTGEKINSLFIREYLRNGKAVSHQQDSKSYPGGYTEVRVKGLVRPVVKADVESLYPSLMLTGGIAPATDTLGIFLPLLRELTNRRLEAKTKAQSSADGTRDHAYWDGLQNSFKVLINSFYGYIGGPFPFNDYLAARRVTEAGQEIVKSIAAELERAGAMVVEIDTDGVYFQPPAGVATVEQEKAFVAQVGQILPKGIRLAHDGSYAAMLSLKMKNYVLVERSGRKIFKGSSLRSRADERYGRHFLAEAIDLLLQDDHERLSARYRDLLEKIEAGEMPVHELARRERVTDKMVSSELRRRAAAAIADAGVSRGDFISLYQRKDKTLALAQEYANDADTDYYANKLHKFASRLREAFTEEEFDRLFPKPIPAAKRPDPNQLSMEDLFG